MNNRSSNLIPLTLEDIFDKTPSSSVIRISEEINYLVQKAQDEGVSVNVLFVIFSFYAQNAMEDIRADAKDRAAKRLEEEKKLADEMKDEVNTNVPTV